MLNTHIHQSKEALNELDDTRIKRIHPLIPPQILMEDIPLTPLASSTVSKGRDDAENIIKGRDDRLLVIVGPCSIHDVTAAMEYAQKLAEYAQEASQDLHIIMRVYFEKPRTTVGWKGLINDPLLDGTFSINKGLRMARKLLLDINELGLPVGCEFLDVISPQYLGDLVSWGAIGARTTESQVHRELASGLSVPVGFKNGTTGDITVAIDAIKAASPGHVFLSVTKQGLSAIVETTGNDSCHVILRGGAQGPNYDSETIQECASRFEKANLSPLIMVDCSHGNSQKQYLNQIKVVKELSTQIGSKQSQTSKNIMGVMIESHLVEGRQNLTDPSVLVYGQSITDSCIGWLDTVKVLDELRKAVQLRRQ